jgi:hypothetical protein
MTEQPVETAVLLLKDKVQRYLGEIVGRVEVDSDGDFTFRQGSSRIYIRCGPWPDTDNTLVHLTVPVLLECKPTPALFEHVATHSDDYLFGHLSAVYRDELVDIYLTHTLLGDYLDLEELRHGVLAMAVTGDRIDNALQEQFGGRVLHDDPE